MSPSEPDPGPFSWRELFSRRSALAWLVLAIALLTQAAVYLHLRYDERDAAAQQFALLADQIAESISRRLAFHEQILLAGAGLFDVLGEVSRAQWHTFVARQALSERYPGIQGVGFSQAVPAPQRARHVEALRAEGFPDYAIYPPGERPLYTSILFLEPFSGRNLAAFGYDMYSEPVRRQAMQRAAETGATSITGKVVLVQEIQGPVQAGLLMYVPVYRQGAPLETAAQRWQALRGFVYSPYRVDDLMQGILGAADLSLNLVVYASDSQDPLQQIFNTRPPDYAHQSRFELLRHIEQHGQTWTLHLSSLPEFESGSQLRGALVMLLGTGLSLSLFFFTFSLLSRQRRTEALAHRMTEDIRSSRQALRESEERLALALKGSNDGLWDLNLDDDSFYASPRAWQILGYGPGEWPAEPHAWEKLMPAEDLAAAKVEMQATLERGANHITTEARLLHKDGHSVPTLLRGYIQRDSQQRPLRISGTITDLTEHKRIEQLKRDFVSTVSHELRTPLTSIHGSLGLINGGALGEVPEPIKPLLHIALQNSARLGHLIDDLLDLEKMEAGKLRFHFTDALLRPSLEEAIETASTFAADHAVVCRLASEPGQDYCVRVDPQRLQQVLGNLLSNAVKHSPPGGEVTIACEPSETRVRVCVSDQGPGIPASFQQRVFTRFAQADSSDSRQKEGSGLGLAISKELIERMGGRIGFDTEPGRGTTFWFELPVQHALTSEDDEHQTRLLVIEDEPDTGRLLHMMLRNAGYAVDRVESLHSARERLAQRRYAALTLDLHLPDGNGRELIEELRREPQTRTLPIVIVSAANNFKPPADDPHVSWLHKPISDAQLVLTLGRVLEKVEK